MWRETLTDRFVWGRALRLGLPVGLLQVAINQGDHWLLGQVTAGVILKSIASPALSTAIALTAAAATLRARQGRNTPPS